MVLNMPFLSLNNANIKFVKLEKFTYMTYTIAKALSTTYWVQLIDKKEFAKMTID